MSVLARLSLRNRGLIGLLAILVLVFGAFVLPKIKQQLFPSLQFPTAVVITPYVGASPDAVDKQVSEPIEAALQGIKGVEEITSTSRAGNSSVVVQYQFGTDLDAAVGQMQQAVNRISTRLPANSTPTVQAGSFDDIPTVVLAVSGEGDQKQLADRLNNEVVPEFKKIEGVRTTTVTGTQKPQVVITLDYAKLAVAGVDPSSLVSTLQGAGAAIPAGTVDQDGKTLNVEIGGSALTVDSLKNTYLAGKTKPVKLGDIATVEAGTATATSITRTNGKPSFGVSVTMASDGNAVAISKAVKDKLPELSSKLGVQFSTVFDQGPEVEKAVSGLTTEGLLGLLFAVIVILLFLFSLRSTLVTAVSIPLSVVVALIALYSGDLSLNLLTLGALTIAVGRVVDDSIVVLENIKRHLGYGEAKQDAVLNGVREVATAVTASTLTTVAVFLPIAFVSGIVGELFAPFSITVTVALLASLLVSLTVVPVLAYWFLKAPRNWDAENAEAAREAAEEKERNGALQKIYVPVVRFAIKRRLVVVLSAIVIFVVTAGLAASAKTDFLGDNGGTTLSMTQELPPGTSLEASEEAGKLVETALAAAPEVKSYQMTVGGNGAGAAFGFGGDGGTSFTVTIAEGTDRKALQEKLKSQLSGKPGAGVIKFGQDASSSDKVSVLVTAPNDAALKPAADQVARALSGINGLSEVTSDLSKGSPQLKVDVDQAAAAAAGLTPATIGQLAGQAVGGRVVTQLPIDGTRTDIVLRTGTAPTGVDAIKALPLPSATGVVRLDQVATVSTVDGPSTVKRTGADLSTSVTAKNGSDNLGAVTKDIETKLKDLKLAGGASAKISGVAEQQTEAFTNLVLALLAAIAIVFLIMAATFRSLVQPLILLVSIPFAATGALLLLRATNTAIGLPAMIGMLMLVGIVVTNAIVLIDLINKYRSDGYSVQDAVVEGGRHRLRPILMTASATIFALLPMGLGITGQGGFIGQPLAIVVIGGLVSSTLLTLVLVPTLYTALEVRKERRALKKAARTPRPSNVKPEHANV
ncbi:efflux RND transporter permease subunit [Amycolatopsis sp. NPDC059657]|uniref:efflux RND transporter permease subunit n=1 Tax=Amycolatopsis sp. NPDC059657 TaxID=3346899 RepID=UPI00366FA1C5